MMSTNAWDHEHFVRAFVSSKENPTVLINPMLHLGSAWIRFVLKQRSWH